MNGKWQPNNLSLCPKLLDHYNQAFGNATPKEKLTALINAGGRIECPEVVKKSSAAKTPSVIATAVVPPTPHQQAAKASISNEKIPADHIRKQVHAAFQSASSGHSGQKALLSALGMEIKKRVDGFKPKNHGHSTLGKLMTALGYRADNIWCFPQQKQPAATQTRTAMAVVE